MRSSFRTTALNDTSFRRFRISLALRGTPGRSIGLIGTRIVSCDLHSRTSGVERRIAGIAAVPIGLAVDLDRLEHGRQAGRGEQDVGRHLVVLEHLAAAGANIGGGDEEMDRRLRQQLEIDQLGENLAQRILAHRIEVVGRHQARHQIHRDIDRRGIERPAAEQHVERPALERAEPGGVRDAPPERLERLARAGGPALLMAVDQHRRVHRAGRRAGNAVDLEPGLFEQAVEHAPGERAMRAAALQREIDQDGIARDRLCCFGRHLLNLKRFGTGLTRSCDTLPSERSLKRRASAKSRRAARGSSDRAQLLILSAPRLSKRQVRRRRVFER